MSNTDNQKDFKSFEEVFQYELIPVSDEKVLYLVENTIALESIAIGREV